ncbi:hypothetical protein CPAR01_08932 [Colletotrichum paranaense]|uniref:Uncharacterized protein n=1 Tax=Colletotrichum paranaense TaxID=1914294 RepID=A0ABQ9SFA2_9PEZI|nr:uncharacterized protein CPAR01_08932 [Colletotrichum paranaense]KAK1535390.1 hypothetical protein CPAR01_08932 [Colletotrichum paranaense]
MSPLTAMSTSSLLCIYTQHAWNVSCFLNPTMLELPDASVRGAESLTVNTKENQTRFSGLRTQNAKQEPISLDSRRCTATTTGNGHVWYRSSPRPRCAPTPRCKNNRLSATITYNISFRLADAAFPIRRRRRSMTGYNLLRRVLFLSAPASVSQPVSGVSIRQGCCKNERPSSNHQPCHSRLPEPLEPPAPLPSLLAMLSRFDISPRFWVVRIPTKRLASRPFSPLELHHQLR